jgi:UDPglucose 6-dehydrogenase
MTAKTRIAVVGLGYVGMSLAVLLARTQDVVALDIDAGRVARVNNRLPTVVDPLMEEIMGRETLSLVATTDPAEAYAGAEFVIVATPTDYDPAKNYFDTSSVETVIAQARAHNPDATIVIKSTIPVGFTAQTRAARGPGAA